MSANDPQRLSDSTVSCSLRRFVLATTAVALACVATTASFAEEPAAPLRAADLSTLQMRCGSAEPADESFASVRQHSLAGAEVLAFEEHRLFIHAVAALPTRDGDRRTIRRFFLLKPSTIVVEELSPASNEPVRVLRTGAEPSIEAARFSVKEADSRIFGETFLPEDAVLRAVSQAGEDDSTREFGIEATSANTPSPTRVLHVFDVAPAGRTGAIARQEITVADDGRVDLTIADGGHVFRLFLPADGTRAGRIEVSDVDGKRLLPRRLLASGIMPHGSQGARLLERWDAPYRGERMPGWDVGRPSSYLVKAVEDGTLKPGRAIVFGCGTGTNAIYLAENGFEVTGVDVAPTALTLAREKAQKAGVQIRWMVADVLALPEMEPFDLVFDRGCYHHVRRYNAAGFVRAVERLSKPGTQALILAGNANEDRHYGPPRVKEEELRGDFSASFDFQWLREIRFESTDPNAKGPLAWSALLRKTD